MSSSQRVNTHYNIKVELFTLSVEFYQKFMMEKARLGNERVETTTTWGEVSPVHYKRGFISKIIKSNRHIGNLQSTPCKNTTDFESTRNEACQSTWT